MGSLACVSIPRLRLQLFGNMAPELRERPMAVISEDKPLGIVLETNRAALQEGVRPGMRYASALSIVPGLQAAAIPDDVVAQTVQTVAEVLHTFSPSVEPARIGAGAFWLNADGLERLFGSMQEWADAICRTLLQPEDSTGGFSATVATGTTRFATYAAARMFRRNTIFSTVEEEELMALQAPLRILPLSPRAAETLFSLGIYTVRDFLALPQGGIKRRFGQEAEDIHRFVHGIGSLPVQSMQNNPSLSRRRRFASPVVSKTAVNNACEQLIADLYEEVIHRQLLVKEVELLLLLENGWCGERTDPISAVLRPAVPTRDRRLLEKLIRLRIEGIEITGPVEEIRLSAVVHRGDHKQSELFIRKPIRDSAAADRAFALIRAELGNDAICAAQLLPEHLPVRRYVWQPIEHLEPPISGSADAEVQPISRVRRISTRRIPVPGPSRSVDTRFLFSGAWWDDQYELEYRYMRSGKDAILWIVENRLNASPRSSGWTIQGSVD